MKTNYYIHIRLIALLFVTAAYNLYSQDQIRSVIHQLGNEKYTVITDKNVYVSGEAVLFKVYPVRTISNSKNSLLSTVYYCDIISESGRIVASGKFPLENNGTSGLMKLSENLSSGTYYFRGYTRWMRNFEQSNFHYTPLFIVNYKIFKDNSLGIPVQRLYKDQQNDLISILLEDSVFNKRDTVGFSFMIKDSVRNKLSNSYTIAIVSTGSAFTNISDFNFISSISEGMEGRYFYPETRGVSLSGIVENEEFSNSQQHIIYLSIPGENPELIASRTNSWNQFFFQLPNRCGEQEMYLIADDPELVYNIDNDLALAKPLNIENHALSEYDTLLFKNIRKQALIQQLNEIYKLKSLKDSVIQDKKLKMFYGDPDYSYNLKDYIRLPAMKDYFHEVFNYVHVVQSGKENSLAIQNESGGYLGNRPLILYDMIPVDLESILSTDPEKIERVELINQVYIRGDIKFDGILSVISKKADYSDIVFKTGGKFFYYNLYSCEHEKSKSDIPQNDYTPDLRTTIYWNDGGLPNNKAPYKFICNDIAGEYQIIIRTVDSMGKVVIAYKEFTIR